MWLRVEELGLMDEQLRFSINRASLDKSEPLSSELFAIRKSMEGQQKDSGMQPVWIREETETVFKGAVQKLLKEDHSNDFNHRFGCVQPRLITTLLKDVDICYLRSPDTPTVIIRLE